jgi:hypothetical protein
MDGIAHQACLGIDQQGARGQPGCALRLPAGRLDDLDHPLRERLAVRAGVLARPDRFHMEGSVQVDFAQQTLARHLARHEVMLQFNCFVPHQPV